MRYKHRSSPISKKFRTPLFSGKISAILY
jgi:hypothetical protein